MNLIDRRLHRPVVFSVLALMVAASGKAITIELDYTYDTNDFTSGGGTVGFFASNAAAKSALEAAAFDLGNSITSQLAAINVAAGASISGSSGGTTVSYNPGWSFTNPTTGATVNLDGLNLAANTFRIYVGSQVLSGSTLGQGGSGGMGYSAAGSFSGNTATYVPAINAAVNATNAVIGRGSPVTIGNLGTSTFNLSGNNYSGTVAMAYGPTLGNLWFDADTDNSGGLDTLAQLNSKWQFDHTVAVTAGKNDFYSVALHEMMHAVGLGASDSWNAKVGTDGDANGKKDWTGASVIALKGTGTDLVDGASSAHIAAGVTGSKITTISTALASSGTQDAVMTPSLTTGTRKIMTDTDQAFLQDMGYTTTTAVPEPSAYGLMGAGALAVVAGIRRRRRRN